MRLSKPSPSLIISMIALVFAMTGTGLAAKSALIDGAKIKDGSITAKKLKKGSVTAEKLSKTAVVPKGWKLLALPLAAKSARSSARAKAALVNKYGETVEYMKVCYGTVIFSSLPCEPPPTKPSSPDPVPGPTGPAGLSAGVAGSMLTRTPGGVVQGLDFAPMQGGRDGTAKDFKTVATASPSSATVIHDVYATISHQDGKVFPDLVQVILYINGIPDQAQVRCAIDTTKGQDHCEIKGPVFVNKNSTMAWAVISTRAPLPPGDVGVYDGFEISVGYSSSTVPDGTMLVCTSPTSCLFKDGP